MECEEIAHVCLSSDVNFWTHGGIQQLVSAPVSTRETASGSSPEPQRPSREGRRFAWRAFSLNATSILIKNTRKPELRLLLRVFVVYMKRRILGTSQRAALLVTAVQWELSLSTIAQVESAVLIKIARIANLARVAASRHAEGGLLLEPCCIGVRRKNALEPSLSHGSAVTQHCEPCLSMLVCCGTGVTRVIENDFE